MPQKNGGPGSHTPGPATFDTTTTVAAHGLRTVAVVVGSAYPPCARRMRWTTVVACPLCDGHHRHDARTFADLGGLRRAGCGRGRYWLALAAAAGEEAA